MAGPEELLAQIFEQPWDFELREVYADALLEAGDPRGELTQLQLRVHRGQQLTALQRRREEELLAAYGDRWAGDVGAVLESRGRTFEAGFLTAGRLAAGPAERAAAVQRSAAWATVRRLHLAWNEAPWIADGAVFRELREVSEAAAATVRALARHPAPPPLATLSAAWPVDRETQGALGQPRALTKLTRLQLRGFSPTEDLSAFAWLVDGPLIDQVELLLVAAERAEVLRPVLAERAPGCRLQSVPM